MTKDKPVKTSKTTKNTKKKPVKIVRKKVADITTEKEFRDSLPGKNKPPFAKIDYARSIICATMVCECGLTAIKVQGPLGNMLTCKGCGSAYALDDYLNITKLSIKQKQFLKYKRNLDLG